MYLTSVNGDVAQKFRISSRIEQQFEGSKLIKFYFVYGIISG